MSRNDVNDDDDDDEWGGNTTARRRREGAVDEEAAFLVVEVCTANDDADPIRERTTEAAALDAFVIFIFVRGAREGGLDWSGND